MAQVTNTNVSSLIAQNNLNRTNSGLNQALERLSSGKRINSAKDDAAGIAIASRFTAQIRGFNQATRNSADAISLAQTAEGALDEISNNLQRIRELAVQSVNATNSDADRSALQVEATALNAEIARVKDTKFNDVDVLKAGEHAFQVGPNAGNTITVTTTAVAAVTVDIDDAVNAALAITAIDDNLKLVNAERANLGAVQNRFESVIRNSENVSANLSAARSRIEDADFAQETANLTKYQILQQAGTSVLSQANALPQSVLGLLG